MNGDNMNNVRCETNRIFRNKKREYLQEKINELQTNSKNKRLTQQHKLIYKGLPT
jgi:hypothetical protein